MNVKSVLFFFVLSVLYLVSGVLLLGVDHLNNISAGALLLAGASFFLLFNEPTKNLTTTDGDIKLSVINSIFRPFAVARSANAKSLGRLSIIILSLNFLMGVVALFLITSKISSTQSLVSTINTVGVLTLVVTQLGGWFFQSCLIYMLAFILDAKAVFEKYLSVVGVGYVGFLILTCLNIGLNEIYIPENISAEEFNSLLSVSLAHGIIGKTGEYWALTVIAATIYCLEDEFTLKKSIFVTVVPSFLLISLKIAFGLAS